MMIKKLIAWLKSLYVSKEDQTVAATTPAATETPVADDSVNDFDSAFEFVAKGIELLGEDAKDELIALAKKYV